MTLLDADEALWLAGLIAEAVIALQHGPCIIIEVDEDPKLWVQILPEESKDEPGTIASFLLNFPYRGQSGDPMALLAERHLDVPPDTQTDSYEDGFSAAVRLRGDIPLLGLAHFAGDVLEQIVKAPSESELAVQVEYGYQT